MTVLLQIGRRPPDPTPDPSPGGHPVPADRPLPGAVPDVVPGAAAEARLFHSAHGAHLFVVDGSRVYDLPGDVEGQVRSWLDSGDARELGPGARAALGLEPGASRRIDGRPIDPPPLSALSLNVMQACNMSCAYCYADEGRFGGAARVMPREVAFAAVDRLLADSRPGADVVVGFMGGEPLLAADLVHEVTAYAARAAEAAGRRARFSLTTNLTELRPADARLFARYPFAVSVSLDGDRDRNDALRRLPGGASAYDRVRAGLDLLARHGRPRHLAARVTVTPAGGRLLDVLDHVIGLGFDEVGFAAVVASPDPALEFTGPQFEGFLAHMVECGEVALRELAAGRRYPFGNFETAMAQIHRGSHRPYPCGAGAGYLSAAANGDLFACHRLVDDPGFAMGSVTAGPDQAARAEHLARGHVDRMSPCRSCWARYLCGGGCYHEVARRGRPGCDYIRGWLAFCLRAYVELSAARPDYFEGLPASSGYGGSGSDPTTVAR
ncbi:radical SAM protein [Frankia sp. R43]|uniref:radical SAM/SPASM domain-containing protein n=1 Tax=Frankia sp. R43 TaxID=269536 RepID=UPI0006CA52BA|nr:radical SAM protein [Frankia sp. R43]